MADTEVMPARQLEVLRIVQTAGPIATLHVALRTRLPVPVASLVLNRLADFGIITYDTTAERWVACAGS